jgi:hypothetical protein
MLQRREVVHCSLAHAPPDAVTLEALARLRLAALQRRWVLVFDDVPAEVAALAELAGLRDVLFGGPQASR